MNPHETDQLLDRTLRALANAEPAPGFTDRLEANLAQHGQAQHSRYRRNSAQRSLRLPLLHVALPLSLTAAVLCAVALLYSHSKRPNSIPRAQPNSSNLAASTLRPEQHPNPTTGSQPATIIPSQLETSKLTAQPDSSSTHTTPALISLHLIRPASTPATADTEALNDFNTPSFPAPPRPVTEQERLVRLMLRHGEKHDLAQLETTQGDAFFRRERSEFADFFDPPPPMESIARQAIQPTAPVTTPPPSQPQAGVAEPRSTTPQTSSENPPSGDPQ